MALATEVGSPFSCSTPKDKIVLGLEIPDLDRVCMGWKFRGAECGLEVAEIMGPDRMNMGWTDAEWEKATAR